MATAAAAGGGHDRGSASTTANRRAAVVGGEGDDGQATCQSMRWQWSACGRGGGWAEDLLSLGPCGWYAPFDAEKSSYLLTMMVEELEVELSEK